MRLISWVEHASDENGARVTMSFPPGLKAQYMLAQGNALGAGYSMEIPP